MKVGDVVKYFPIRGLPEFKLFKVDGTRPNGIPSHPFPMVRLIGKAGLVDEAHCELATCEYGNALNSQCDRHYCDRENHEKWSKC